ncbi:type IV pilus modification PilV family protein [Elongatibacter sediminis]|uniref:Uncharacterized protein n=1 Tax=Elongatibacter sediminis TaxID=3119006 RepID=A0AAW9RFM1_9GAMM
MKPYQTLGTSFEVRRREQGTTLLEVLLAIVIFIVGMMALVHLQGNLTRSSTDANLRTVAANFAEELIEERRAFEKVPADGTNTTIEFQEIVDQTITETRGGIVYTADIDVENYYFDEDQETVTSNVGDLPSEWDTSVPDFKHVTMTVTWDGSNFDTGSTGGNRLGSGSLVVTQIIPSIPPLGTAQVASESDGELGGPSVDYTPGLNPDIIAIQIGDNKFKESTTPEPVVVRRDELMETWFDVVTYSTTDSNSVFIRREEFVAISCDCTLRNPSGSGEDGRQPTIWTGAEYAEGEFVAKQYGESASNQQSQYCDVCCRDHHDTAGGPNSYIPDSPSSSGNHPHYSRSNQGALQVVSAGSDYVEACRMVRKDGFFRVAQDFTLESQLAFPENYLDESGEVTAYSDYVKAAVVEHFQNPSNNDPWAHNLSYDGRDTANPTDLPTGLLQDSQQLRSRGIYADLVSTQLQANLLNCFDIGGTGDRTQCEVPQAGSALELYPFFDVQVTQLARWSENQPDDPIDITNEEIANNGYSRGVAELAGTGQGTSVGDSKIEDGNYGLVSIAPNLSSPAYSDAYIYMRAGLGTNPPQPTGKIISGTLVNSNQAGNAVASVTGNGANCTRPTNTTFQCVLDDPLLVSPTLTVSNYYKRNKLLVAESGDLTMTGCTQGGNLSANSTTFALPTTTTSNVSIVVNVTTATCP